MKKTLIVAVAALLASLFIACGGDDNGGTATAQPETTTVQSGSTAEATATTADLTKDVSDLRGIMKELVDKAEAGDTAAVKDLEPTMDDPMEAIVEALRDVNPALADELEGHELAIEEQADSDSTDLEVIATEAEAVLDQLDEISSALGVELAASTMDPAELATDLGELRSIMKELVEKADAGDTAAVKDLEPEMDEPMEAIVDALRGVDPALADELEGHELNIEDQADSDSTDLEVIATEAEAVLGQLNQIASTLGVDLPAETMDTTALAKDVADLRDLMTQIVAKADAGDTAAVQDLEPTMDEPMEAVVDALRSVDTALADELEGHELNIEEQADSSAPDLGVIADEANAVIAMLDQVATALGVS